LDRLNTSLELDMPQPIRYRMPKTLKERKAMVLARFQVKNLSALPALGYTFKKTSFKNLVREVADESKVNLNWKKDAFGALAEAAQAYLTKLFEDADLCRAHVNRKVVRPADLQLARALQLPKI
jgi:histone H3/H4